MDRLRTLGIPELVAVVKVLGAPLTVGLLFAAACGVPFYLELSDAGVTLDVTVQRLLIVAAAVVLIAAMAARTLIQIFGPPPGADVPQPPAPDRRGEDLPS